MIESFSKRNFALIFIANRVSPNMMDFGLICFLQVGISRYFFVFIIPCIRTNYQALQVPKLRRILKAVTSCWLKFD